MPKGSEELRLRLDVAMSQRSAMWMLGPLSFLATFAGLAATLWLGLR